MALPLQLSPSSSSISSAPASLRSPDLHYPSFEIVVRSRRHSSSLSGFGLPSAVVGLSSGIRSSLVLVRAGRLPVVGAGVSRLSLQRRSLEFGGLKMSTAEGLTRRVRDPQLAANESREAAKKGANFVKANIGHPGLKTLLIAVAIPLVLGFANSIVNSPFSTWFKDLKKPWWEPPGPIFGGAWGILYPVMGLASWLVWAEGGFHKQGHALGLYVGQLVLNLLWPVLFFGFKNLSLALVDIVALAGVLTLTINAFKPVNHVAANLLKPYLAWVLFATALNVSLLWKNRGAHAS